MRGPSCAFVVSVRSEILLREPVALLPRGAPQSFDVIENPCGAEYAGMIEITGERTLVRVAERGEFFRQIESLIPPGFDQRPCAPRRG